MEHENKETTQENQKDKAKPIDAYDNINKVYDYYQWEKNKNPSEKLYVISKEDLSKLKEIIKYADLKDFIKGDKPDIKACIEQFYKEKKIELKYSCKNKALNLSIKENKIDNKNEYSYTKEKGKKLIPNHPLKNAKISFGNNDNELNKYKQQKYYYKSHNNLEQDTENSNFKKYNNNILKKLFIMSPTNQMSDKNIIIQNNNININNNFNIKKKCPFVLNFNQKEKNNVLENMNNPRTTKGT